MLTEADTCRKYVVPKLQGAGWDNDPHSIAEQRFFTDGRIIVRGSQATRRPGKKADFILANPPFNMSDWARRAKICGRTCAGNSGCRR